MRISPRPILLIAIVVLVSAGLHGQTTGAHAQAQTETWRFALTRMIDGYQNRYIDVGVLTCDTSSTAGQSGDTPACTFQVTASTRDRFYADNPIFSPADDRLAYFGEGSELYSVNPIDMQPFQITQDETIYIGAAWSADGQWLLFDGAVGPISNGNLGIKAVRSDGSGDPLIVSPAGIDAGSPTASSTGDEFAYITFNSGDSELVLSRLSEPGITRVLTEVNSPVRVRWSPVDDRLAVLNLNEQTSGLELITINSDGSNYHLVQLMYPEIYDFEWAPDGNAIFYTVENFLYRIDLNIGEDVLAYANLNEANGYRSDGTFSLARMDTVAPTATATATQTFTASSTSTRTFTPTATSAQAQTETWRFALTRRIDDYPTSFIDVGVLTCDTSSTAGQSGDTPACTFQVTASTRDRFFAQNPIFSPADDRLAYFGEGSELYSVNPIDMQPFQITQDETIYIGAAWSADGQWLLFDSSVGLEDKAIKAVRSDGSETPLIVSLAGIDAGSPTASSTGDEFAYITFNSGDSELVLSRLSEPGITRVLTEVNRPVRVRWSPVDDRLAVLNLNEQTSELELITINSDGSGYREYPTTLSEISDLEWAPDGSAIFFMFLNFLYRLDLDTGTVTIVYANLNEANGAMSDGTFSLARMDTFTPTATSTPTRTFTASSTSTRTFTPTATSAQAQTETWRFALTRMIDGYQNRYIDVGVLTCDTSSTAGQSGDTPACTFQVTASTRDRFYAENPTFSPADDWLAFIGESGDLYTATALELQPIQITQNESAYRKPDWSADGQWLLFDSSVGLEDKAIKAVRSDGSETPIIVSPGGITAGSPTGSSSGDEFAYITFTFDDSELVLSRLSEPGITRVLTEVNRPVRVRWSPVDDRLAVLNLNEQTSGLDLITINSDGSGYREYPTTFSEISDLEWAPDGSAIFFSFLNFLFRLDLDTGTVTMVYANLNQANGAMSDGTFSLARMDTVAPTATATGEPAPSPTP